MECEYVVFKRQDHLWGLITNISFQDWETGNYIDWCKYPKHNNDSILRIIKELPYVGQKTNNRGITDSFIHTYKREIDYLKLSVSDTTATCKIGGTILSSSFGKFNISNQIWNETKPEFYPYKFEFSLTLDFIGLDTRAETDFYDYDPRAIADNRQIGGIGMGGCKRIILR